MVPTHELNGDPGLYMDKDVLMNKFILFNTEQVRGGDYHLKIVSKHTPHPPH